MEEWIEIMLTAIGGAIIGFVASLLALRFNYKQLFAETVSKSRNVWLNEMRENISILLAESSVKFDKNNPSFDIVTYHKAKNQVLLRMNNSEPLHLMLTKEIKSLDNCTDENSVRMCQENILTTAEQILKREWEHVKTEAKGGK